MQRMAKEQAEKRMKGDPDLTDAEMMKYKADEKELRIELMRAISRVDLSVPARDFFGEFLSRHHHHERT